MGYFVCGKGNNFLYIFYMLEALSTLIFCDIFGLLFRFLTFKGGMLLRDSCFVWKLFKFALPNLN